MKNNDKKLEKLFSEIEKSPAKCSPDSILGCGQDLCEDVDMRDVSNRFMLYGCLCNHDDYYLCETRWEYIKNCIIK